MQLASKKGKSDGGNQYFYTLGQNHWWTSAHKYRRVVAIPSGILSSSAGCRQVSITSELLASIEGEVPPLKQTNKQTNKQWMILLVLVLLNDTLSFDIKYRY